MTQAESRRIQLYASPFGGSAIAEAALTLCRLDYETIDIEFEALEACEPLRAINPLCQIPTVVLADGGVMSESAAIVLYLGSKYPDVGLVPAQASSDYAEFLRWLVFVVANIYPTFTYGDFPQRWVGSKEAQDELVASTDSRRQEHWKYLEEIVHGRAWFLDSGFTALDIYVWVMSHWRPGRGWFERECPNLFRIAAALDVDPRLQAVRARNFVGRV